MITMGIIEGIRIEFLMGKFFSFFPFFLFFPLGIIFSSLTHLNFNQTYTFPPKMCANGLTNIFSVHFIYIFMQNVSAWQAIPKEQWEGGKVKLRQNGS